MQSMAISLADSLGRTARGDQELAQAQHGLSVAQRKLLAQLNSPGTLEDLARDNGWDADYANKTATRLVELGLVNATAGASSGEEPQTEAGATILPIGRAAPKLSTPWPAAVGAGIVVAAVGVWWAVSSNSSSSVEKIAQAPSPKASTPAAPAGGERSAPVDPKGTELPKAVYSMTLQQPQVAAAPTSAPAAAPAPQTAAQAAKPSAPAVATRGLSPAPAAKTPEPAVASPAPAVAPAPAPAAEAPAKTLVAAAAPAAAEATKPSAPAATERALKIVQREEPGFPREAILAGVGKGTVKARLTVDASGSVTKVDILEANPRRVFDREVQRTLARWKFEATGQTQTAETEVVFNRE